MAKIKYHFPRNNMTVEVDSLEKLKQVSAAIGEPVNLDKTYNSSSKGLVFIKDMDTSHVMRVARKRTVELLDEVMENARKEYNQKASIGTFIDGYLAIPEDKLLSDLMTELSSRFHS